MGRKAARCLPSGRGYCGIVKRVVIRSRGGDTSAFSVILCCHVGASHIAGPMRHEEEWQPRAVLFRTLILQMTKKKRIELQKHDNIPMPRGIACQRFGVKKNGLKSRQAIFLFFVNRIIDGSVCCCNTLAIANRCGSWHCGSLSPQKRCYCRGAFDVEMKLPRKTNVVNQVTSALLAHLKKAVFPILAQVQN